jgi:4-methylaminobutanoate oxidase (formaldehyde-forming)
MVPHAAQIVVIGGGVLGTSAAFHLAAAGHKDIVLLDRGPIAGGTTPFAAGQTAYLPAKDYLLPFTSYCLDFFEHFAERTGYAIDFHQHGSLRVALTEEHVAGLHRRLELAASLGDNATLLTPQQARELVPALEVPEARGILYAPRDGFVEPRSVAAAYAAAARDRGVSICTRTPVSGIDVAEGAVRAVRTPAGTIQTRRVVVAAGAWTRQFCQSLDLNLRVVPVRHQAVVTAPLAVVRPQQPVVRIVETQVYARPEAGGLLVGGYGYRPLSFDMHDFPPDFEIPDLEADQIYYQQLLDAAARHLPVLREAVVIQERRGLPTMTPDGLYLVSEVDAVQGLIVMTGCQVGGIWASPGLGRIVADVVSGQESLLPAAASKVDRFADAYAHDTSLRSRCEQVYACHYLDMY